MEKPLPGQQNYFEAFIKAAQYLAGLTAQQDIWSETGKVLVNFFGAEVGAVEERQANGETARHRWAFSERYSSRTDLEAETREAIAEVLECGFLSARIIFTPDPLSIACFPISRENQVVAVMVVGHGMPEPLPRELLNVYLTVAGLVGTTVGRLASERELWRHRRQLQENEKQITALLDKSEQSRRALLSILEDEQLAEEELSRVNRALRMLSDTNQALIHITDEATLLNDACRIAVEVGGYRMAWVGFAEHDEAKTLRPVAHAGFDSGYIESANVSWANNERGRGPGGIAIRTGQPCMAHNISEDPVFAPWREAAIQRGYKSIIALPLISEGQAFGMLVIYAGKADAFDAKEVEILKELADDLAFGIIALRTRAKRDQAEEALHESEERYRLIAENTADTITVLDLSLNPIYVSPSVLKLRGYTVQEEMAQSLDQILTPESQQKAKNLFAEQMALESSGKADPARTALIELEEYCKDGSTIWVELAASFLRDNNFKPTGILTVTRNITERKKAEKEKEKLMSQLVQAQKMEAIGTLAGGIAHDFNNILGALIGYTELAIGESREEKKQHHLEQVLKACNRAKNLVKQILSFSRHHEKELKTIDMGIIAKEALKLLRASLPATIEIRQSIAAVPAMVFADPTWIHQILMNFCTNAAHAMREKGGLLTVSLANVNISPDTPPISPYLQAGHYVQMTVSDTGHGINPAILDRIFDPFFTTKDEGEGTGLGLSVVYGIVNSLGGTITVQSEPGKGAAFDVYLPLIDAGMRREAESISQVLPTGTERILFVDDEESLREIMKAMLQSLGYDVVATSSSEEALKFFLEKPERFDLVITDMTMPHMTGVELAKKLMEMRPGLPIILSTGFSQRISEDKAKDIGIRKFLMKPVSVTDLALSVRGVLDDVKKGR